MTKNIVYFHSCDTGEMRSLCAIQFFFSKIKFTFDFSDSFVIYLVNLLIIIDYARI